jgi:hypothetical protein
MNAGKKMVETKKKKRFYFNDNQKEKKYVKQLSNKIYK